MPRFHFEIIGGYTVPDPAGMDLPTEQEATKVAREIAKQLSIDITNKSFKEVVVKTDDGREVYRAPIKSDESNQA